MSKPYEVHEVDGVRVEIHMDDEPLNPRREYDNMAIMACYHNRYDLGDKNGHDKVVEAIRNSALYDPMWEEDNEDGGFGFDFKEPSNLILALELCSDITFQPLYLYDHSGLTMRTSPFSCNWDSGQVGMVILTHDTVRKEFGISPKDSVSWAKCEEIIKAEVSCYDDFLTGNCWGYVIKEIVDGDLSDDSGEVLESCFGFLGDIKHCQDEAKNIAEGLLQRIKERKAREDWENSPMSKLIDWRPL